MVTMMMMLLIQQSMRMFVNNDVEEEEDVKSILRTLPLIDHMAQARSQPAL